LGSDRLSYNLLLLPTDRSISILFRSLFFSFQKREKGLRTGFDLRLKKAGSSNELLPAAAPSEPLARLTVAKHLFR
jgi:hypothetical protein